MKDNFFMTEKEREYVAECFLRNVKYLSSSIDYKNIFNSPSVKMDNPFVDQSDKKIPGNYFGRELKKTIKTPNHHSGIPIDHLNYNLRLRYKLEDIISKLIFHKYYTVNDTTVQDTLETVNLEIEELVSFDKFFILLDYLISEIETHSIKFIYISLVNNYESIRNPDPLRSFLDTNLSRLPAVEYDEIPKAFIERFMYNDSGILLATSLIIINNDLVGYFYYYIIVNESSFLDNDYIWMFLAVLISLVDDDKKFKLVEITRMKIFELKQKGGEKFDKTEYFLKAIGLSKEDVL
ncbi:hypothetical protein NGRA_0768 [Nosema granulosis]|uniref:Uncharacterized protein n=1 Tax=Nosema granulosis TaxID=83296 RepID=A0A9P6GZS0_9MICR|nr:hypothetical protein NGRA_0768 [Nosema granulosis]